MIGKILPQSKKAIQGMLKVAVQQINFSDDATILAKAATIILAIIKFLISRTQTSLYKHLVEINHRNKKNHSEKEETLYLNQTEKVPHALHPAAYTLSLISRNQIDSFAI